MSLGAIMMENIAVVKGDTYTSYSCFLCGHGHILSPGHCLSHQLQWNPSQKDTLK